VYKSLKLSVLGKPYSGYGTGYLSLHNFAKGTEDAVKYSGRSYEWYSTTATGTNHVNTNGIVRGYYTVLGWDRGHYDVAKVKLTYTYGLLK
jgi:hypothetical protein